MDKNKSRKHSKRSRPVKQGQVIAPHPRHGGDVKGSVLGRDRRRLERQFHDKYGSDPLAAGAVRDRVEPSGFTDHETLIPNFEVGSMTQIAVIDKTVAGQDALENVEFTKQPAGEVVTSTSYTEFVVGTGGFGALLCTGVGMPFLNNTPATGSGMIATNASYTPSSSCNLAGGIAGWSTVPCPVAVRGPSVEDGYGAILLGLRLRVRSVSSTVSSTKGLMLIGQTNGDNLSTVTATTLMGKRWCSFTSVFPQMDDPVLVVKPSGLYCTSSVGFMDPTNGGATAAVWSNDFPGGFGFIIVKGANAGDIFTVEVQQRILYLGPAVSNNVGVAYDSNLWACVDRCMSLALLNDSGFTVFSADSGSDADGKVKQIADDATGHSVLDQARSLPGQLFQLAIEKLPSYLLEAAYAAL